MSTGPRDAWLQLFGCSWLDEANDWQLIEWRANYEEARTIANYFRFTAARKSQPGRDAHGEGRIGKS